MKKLVALLLVSFMATSAMAVVDPDPDMIGLYFDELADQPCVEGLAPYVPTFLYVIVTNPTIDAIGGFECEITWDGAALVTGVTFPTDFVNVGNNTNIIVGYSTPIPTTTATIVARVDFLYTDTAGGPTGLYMGPSNPSSNEFGYPTVLDGALNEIPWGTSTVIGEYNAMVNGNCEGVVANEDASWGSVKSLYR